MAIGDAALPDSTAGGVSEVSQFSLAGGKRIKYRTMWDITPWSQDTTLISEEKANQHCTHLGGALRWAAFSTAREEVDTILGVSGLRPPVWKGERLFSRKYVHIVAAFGGGFACLGASAALLGWRAQRWSRHAVRGIFSGRISRRRLLAGLALAVPGGLLVGTGAGREDESVCRAIHWVNGFATEFASRASCGGWPHAYGRLTAGEMEGTKVAAADCNNMFQQR